MLVSIKLGSFETSVKLYPYLGLLKQLTKFIFPFFKCDIVNTEYVRKEILRMQNQLFASKKIPHLELPVSSTSDLLYI